jgi:competence protein ComEC
LNNRNNILLKYLTFVTILILANFFYEYIKFTDLKSQKIQEIETVVINQYKKTKNNRSYYVLKCKNSDFTFYTTSWKKSLQDLKNKKISIKIVTKNITFYDYLKGFFAPSFHIKVLDSHSYKNTISNFIKQQHENIYLKEFFSAIFLATPISYELRQISNIWGISHIIAISGYHLGIIASFLFFVILYPYKFFQQRLFPFNNRKKSILYITILLLFIYLYFLDFVPSLFRAFIMYCIGVFLLLRNIKIFNYATLLITILLAISIFPKILFSLGFWLSISGVFYIYLYIQYFSKLNKFISFVFFNFFIFVAMMPIVHNFFPIFSYYQLLSPILTMSFAIFYPLEIILHMFQIGYLLDDYLLFLIAIKKDFVIVNIDFYLFIFYVILSLLSIYKRIFFICLNIFMISFFIFALFSLT